jgi:hypothetical protein
MSVNESIVEDAALERFGELDCSVMHGSISSANGRFFELRRRNTDDTDGFCGYVGGG